MIKGLHRLRTLARAGLTASRFAGPLERHRDLDAGLALELGGREVAPFGLHRADDIQLLRERG